MPVPIVAAVRSPFAVADGVLAGWHPVDLAARIVEAALAAAGLEPEEIDHVWAGCDEPVGGQGANVARAIVLAAGLPETVAGTVVEAAPHSGMSALASAADAVAGGRVRTAIVVGVGSSSMVQPGASALGRLYGRPWGDAPAGRYAEAGGLVPPVLAADRAAVAAGIDAAAQDAWGLRSLDRRHAASRPAGIISVGARPGDAVAIQRDTPVDDDAIRSISLDDLRPIFDEDGTTTAAGFAPAGDGCAAVILQAAAPASVAELVATSVGAGSPFDVAGPAHAAAPDATTLDLAVSSASAALLAARALDREPDTIDREGGTIAVGDAGAAEDLRVVVDGMHRSEPGARGGALRVAAGAAAGCTWRRP